MSDSENILRSVLATSGKGAHYFAHPRSAIDLLDNAINELGALKDKITATENSVALSLVQAAIASVRKSREVFEKTKNDYAESKLYALSALIQKLVAEECSDVKCYADEKKLHIIIGAKQFLTVTGAKFDPELFNVRWELDEYKRNVDFAFNLGAEAVLRKISQATESTQTRVV